MPEDFKKPFISISGKDIFIYPYELPTPQSFNDVIKDIDSNSFKFSHPWYEHIYNKLVEVFNKFPDCCELHRKIALRPGFKKEVYDNLPEKITTHIAVVIKLINERYLTENWFLEITDLIDWHGESYGSPAVGEYNFHVWLKHTLEQKDQVTILCTDEQREKAIEYVSDKLKPRIPVETADWNDLALVFHRWQSAIPDLEVFKEIKASKFPIALILYDTHVNMYSGLSKSRSKTVPEFYQVLVNLSKNIFATIDYSKLVQEGQITDAEKLTIEIIGESLKLKQASFLELFTPEEMNYVNIAEGWLKLQEEYFLKLAPFHSKISNYLNSQSEIENTKSSEGEYRKGDFAGRPILNQDAVQDTFSSIKGFFSQSEHDHLLALLETGEDVERPLVFLDNGNRLGDTFKQLIKDDIITGCNQVELEAWIQKNFMYRHKKEIKAFSLRYLNDIISSNNNPCKKPIIKIVNGKVGRYL